MLLVDNLLQFTVGNGHKGLSGFRLGKGPSASRDPFSIGYIGCFADTGMVASVWTINKRAAKRAAYAAAAPGFHRAERNTPKAKELDVWILPFCRQSGFPLSGERLEVFGQRFARC
jgi:hypothetical protein